MERIWYGKQGAELRKSRQILAIAADAELLGDWVTAVESLKEVDTRNWAETRLLVRALLGTGDYLRALDLIMNDFQSHPNGAWEHFVVAIALKNIGQHERAQEHYLQGVQLDTKDLVRGNEIGRLRTEAATLLMFDDAPNKN